MNIIFIHACEVLVVLLIVGTLVQIRKLYLQSSLNKSANTVNRRHSVRQVRVSKCRSTQSYIQKSSQKIKADVKVSSRFNLPLPEVSFTDALSQPDEAYLSEGDFNVANEQHYSRNKAELNSYIEDMFFETTYEFFEEPKPAKFKRQATQLDTRDDFITVAEENAYLVRELQMLNNRASYAG